MEQDFIRLVTDHERIILKICNVYCYEQEDREDLYQDILLQLWKSFPAFSNRSKVTTWLYRVALNTAITRFRKLKKKPDMVEINERVAMIPINDVSNQERMRQLYAAIEGLNKIDKAITLLYLEEAKYAEIAEIMGISESNVGFKINRIKKILRDKLKIEQL